MDAVTHGADWLHEHPILRTGFAAVAAVGLVVMPFDAMNAGAAAVSKSVDEWDEPCEEGCDTIKEICCNEPIP